MRPTLKSKAFRVVSLSSLALAVLSWHSTSCHAAEGLPEKTAVLSSIREYLSSIQSVHVHFNFWSTFDPNKPSKQGSEAGPQKVEWAEQGSQKLLDIQPMPGRQPQDRYHATHDGQTAYTVDFDPDNVNRIRSILKTPVINSAYTDYPFLPAHFFGLRIPSCHGTLLDVLKTESTSFVSRESIGDASCLHVHVPDVIDAGGFHTTWDFWLDEEKEYLPRRMVFKITDDSPRLNAKVRNIDWIYEVQRFVQVDDQLLNRSRWFPAAMSHSSKLLNWRIETETIEINRKLPIAKFRPEMPVGTVVVEGESIPHMPPPKSYVVGGEKAVTKLVDQQLNVASKLKEPGPLIDARKETRWNWTTLLGVVSLVLLTLVVGWHVGFRR